MAVGKSAKSMSKSAIVSHLAEKLELQKKVVNAFFDEFSKLAYKEAKNSFTVPGIGKLVLVHRKARTGRNPATGEVIDIPAKTVVKFRVSKLAKDAIVTKK
jgi:DNA-binding protein HU-beta